MSEDCGTNQKKLNESQSSIDDFLSKPFVKFTIEGLLECWLEAEGLLKHKVVEGGRGDVESKRLKLVEKYKTKPERVWLQGYIVNVSKDCKCFEISDSPDTETGAVYPAKSGSFRHSVFIVNCANAPAGINHSMKGKYCQGN